MRKIIAMLALAAAGCGTATAQPVQPPPAKSFPIDFDAPAITLAAGPLKAKVYLPGGDKPFYNGTRFDQAGMVGSLTLSGREFYGPWYDRTAPEVMDYVSTRDAIIAGPDSAVSGPVEEFNTDGKALGYDAAPVGGTFIKIGVGVLKKPDDKPYDHYRHYQIVDPGQRATTHTVNSVTFIQTVKDPASGYGYVYSKTLRLTVGRPQMVIAHTLHNTGTKPIITQVYDHNFLRLSPGNANLVLTLPFKAQVAQLPPADAIRIEGKTISFLRPVVENERRSFLITGFGDSAQDYVFTIADGKTGASVRVVGDHPVTRLNLFAVRSVMAIEPYNDLEIPPGGETAWSYTYSYALPGPTPRLGQNPK